MVLLEQIHNLVWLQPLAVREGIAAMPASQQRRREVREEGKGLMREDPDWERPDREIRADIILTAALGVVEVGLEQ
jgi:hypothetical protein